jgi:hypothetical protein
MDDISSFKEAFIQAQVARISEKRMEEILQGFDQNVHDWAKWYDRNAPHLGKDPSFSSYYRECGRTASLYMKAFRDGRGATLLYMLKEP